MSQTPVAYWILRQTAMRLALLRRAAISAASCVGLGMLRTKPPSCTSDADKEAFAKLMETAGVPSRYLDDLAAVNAGSVTGLMSIGESKLSLDPPDANTLHAVLKAARDKTSLTDPHVMPARDGTEHAKSGAADADAAKEAYVLLHAQATMLCRLAKEVLPSIVKARALAAATPDAAIVADEKAERERELDEVKHPTAKATALRQAAYETYNVRLGTARHERRAADDQLVKTHQNLKLHRLQIAALNSTKYGRLTAIDRPQTTLTVSSDASTLVASEEHLSLGRYSETLQCIYACIDSLVEAGLIEIDPKTQPLAADTPHGKLRDGRQVEFDLQAGLALKSAYLALSDCLSGKALAQHWAEHFVAAAANDMHGGHSLASSTMALMSTSVMRPSEHLASTLSLASTPTKAAAPADASPPSSASSSSSTASGSADTAKMTKRIAHLERQNEELLKAKQRRIADAKAARERGGYYQDYPPRGGYQGGYRGGDRGGSDRDRDHRDGQRRN